MNHINPKYYQTEDKEVWEQMIDLYGLEAFLNFCELNHFKYLSRAGKKEGQPLERDLEKAKWYKNKVLELTNKNILK